MKKRSAQLNPGVSSNLREIVRRSLRVAGTAAFAIAVLFAATAMPVFSQQPAQTTSIPGVKCVIGVENHKPNSTGTLSVLPTGLEFKTEKTKSDIPTASITDIFVGNQSRQNVTGAGKVVTMGIPYGGGRIVSLFSHKVQVLTVEYTDSNGAFHGAIFVLPQGEASMYKDQLVKQGAKVTEHVEPPAPPKEEQKP
jgi:hypothetical protein